MQLIFIRHAESIDAVDGVSQRNNSQLSKKGVSQAKKRASDFTTINPTVCYTSHYTRARETARLLFPSTDFITRQDIFEIIRPTQLDGGNHAEAIHFWEVTHVNDKYSPQWSLDGSETFAEVAQRAHTFLEEIKTIHSRDTNPIVIVSHGGFIRHCIGVACKGSDYKPSDFFDLLLPMTINNLDAISLTIAGAAKPSWYMLPHSHD